jgi:mono/diheme cytochrome c family protein
MRILTNVLRGIGIVLAGVVVLVLLALGGVYLNAQRLLAQRPDNPVSQLTVTQTPDKVARGRYLVTAIPGCVSCHATNPTAEPPVLDGALMRDIEPFGEFWAPNLTPGGRLRDYSDGALERAIREGIGHDGRALAIMPSGNFSLMPDDDVEAVIAYLRTQPSVEHQTPPLRPNLLGYVLIGTGLAAPSVQPPVADVSAPPRGTSAAYGDYLSQIGDCRACHGALLDGQNRSTGAPPGPNLRVVKGWTDEQFIKTLRTGVDPSGHLLDPRVMPWPQFGRATDDDLRALHAYLQSLP